MRISDWSSDVCSSDLERARHLRHPFPEEQAQPVAQAARPDPEIAAPVDRDLGDAFHARAHHRVPVAGQLGLDAKAVLAVDAGGDGRNLADREGYRVAGESGRREAACLAGLQIVDVLFGDMEHDAEIAERRDLEQHFALLDRRADALAELQSLMRNS